MKLLQRREPQSLATFRNEFDQLFQSFFGNGDVTPALPRVFRQGIVPNVDVIESEKSFTFAVELPGLNEKDIQIELMGRQLVITAERKWEEETKGKEYRRVESQYGTFQRAIELPENARASADSIQATYKRGVLEVTIPKVEPTPTAKIAVKTG